MYRYFLLSLFLFPFFSSAQKSWTVQGVVRGDQGELLAGASVFAEGVLQTLTDTAGRYVFRTEKMPELVTVRYFGYFAQKKALDAESFADNLAVLDFQLMNQEPSLKEVVITAKPIEVIVKEDFSTDLYDFGFAGRYLLLLMRDAKRYYLRLTEDDGTVVAQLRLPQECRVLHRSCLGDFHVSGDQWAWEVVVEDGKLDTLPRYSADNFHKFVEPCAQQSAGRYYFIQRGILNQSVRYLVFENNQAPRVAFNILDERGMEIAQMALQDFFDGKPMILRSPERQAGMSGGDEVHNTWGKFGNLSTVEGLTQLSGYGVDQIYRISELEVIRRDSVYAPMFKLGDTLCLFDHTNGRITRFGPKLDRTDVGMMHYHLEDGWEKLLLQDGATNRMYSKFADRGALILKEIDPKTGRSGKKYALQLAPYISEKFKIRNGVLYFIGQPDVNTPNKMLYKMNIFAGLVR